MRRILFVLLAVLAALPVVAQQPTAAQLEAFRNLPQSEQQRLMQRAGVQSGTGRVGVPQDVGGETPSVAASLDRVRPFDAEKRIEPGDTLVIRVSGDAPAALMGLRTLLVDSEGRVRLPVIDRVMVADLNSEQAAERLAAESALRNAQVSVDILPVRRTGLSRLRPFGYDLFRDSPTTFAPTAAVSVPHDYPLGPGDVINVQLFGNESGLYGLEVTREGQILFPQIGPITVAGMSFGEVQTMIVRRVSEHMIGTRASVTMGPLRTIRVFVLGEATQPGAYTVSALTTATNALFVSGGVRQVGSLRNIEIKRRGETVAQLDLYDLLLRGDTRGDLRLQADDVVFIPPAGPQIAIDGPVRRPAIYEFKGERTIAELLELAGGLLPTAFPQMARLERIDAASGERTLLALDLTAAAGRNTLLRTGDFLSIGSVLDRIDGTVRVTGHVQRPQVREWTAGLRISDLISDLNMLLPAPDLDYALIRRESGPTRRVSFVAVDLGRVLASTRSEHDLELAPNDELFVFGLEEVDERRARIDRVLESVRAQSSHGSPAPIVTITGPVRAGGAYPLGPGMRASDLLRAGGGLAESAYMLSAEMTRVEFVTGDEQRMTHFTVDLEALMDGDGAADIVLQPRDVLTIMRKPYWAERATIELRGEVRFPGTYTLQRSELLSDVIQRAGGLTPEANPRASVFMREALREREAREIERLAERLEFEIATSPSSDDASRAEQIAEAHVLAQQLRKTTAIGRLVIDLEGALAHPGDKNFDVSVEDGDVLVIPHHSQEVTVLGEVHYPTSHFWQTRTNLQTYIGRSGGMTSRAARRQVYVVRANGSVATGRAARTIAPGDTIVVPLQPDRVSGLQLAGTISQIFYQFGLSAAAAKTVGIF